MTFILNLIQNTDIILTKPAAERKEFVNAAFPKLINSLKELTNPLMHKMLFAYMEDPTFQKMPRDSDYMIGQLKGSEGAGAECLQVIDKIKSGQTFISAIDSLSMERAEEPSPSISGAARHGGASSAVASSRA